MQIERFRVKEIDDFGGRVAEARTDKITFETPTRAATSTEYNYKKRLRIDEAFENNVGEYVARFNEDDIDRFSSKNGSYASRLRAAAAAADQMKFVASKAYPQSPFDHRFDEETLRLMLEVQVESGLDMVSIPYSTAAVRNGLSYFHRWADHVNRYAATQGREVVAVPYVPMNLKEEAFRTTLTKLWDARSEFPVIGLTYASIRENKINYSFLRRNRKQDSWLHMSAVARVPPAGTSGGLAQMHLPQIYGIDSVSSSIPWGGVGEPPPDYQKLRYFDRPTLTVPRIEDWVRIKGRQRTNCPCVVCQNRTFREIVRSFIEQRAQTLDLSPLFGVFRLHEVFESTREFEEGKTYISENSFAEYLEARIGRAVDEFREPQALF